MLRNKFTINYILAIIILIICYFISFTQNSYAYLDPGTGSMLLSALFGIVATAFFVLKGLYYKILRFIMGLFGVKIKQTSKYEIVFYSEGASYWDTFKPVIQALDKLNQKCVYLSSDEKDLGLQYESTNVDTQYIGTGNKAFMMLNMLEADVFALTTPGLGVLQIKKSKGVKHYSHILHTCTDLSTYKLFSFEHYDSILTNGQYQEDTIRYLENARNTNKKEIYRAGVPYMDELAKKLMEYKEAHKADTNKETQSNQDITVLISPTWRRNGMLTKFGSKAIKPILEAGYKVIIRPHPQSYKVEQDMLNQVMADLKEYDNLTWDNNADNFESLMNSDIMVSDLSGIIYDYAFIFEKPVITIEFNMDYRGLDCNFYRKTPWEIEALSKVGTTISIDKITSIDQEIKRILSNNDKKEEILNLRNETLANYGNVGMAIAEKLMATQQQVSQKETI